MHSRSPNPATPSNPAHQKETATPSDTPKSFAPIIAETNSRLVPDALQSTIKTQQSTISPAKSLVRKILPASPLFPRFCAESFIPSGPNCNETRILAPDAKKNHWPRGGREITTQQHQLPFAHSHIIMTTRRFE